MTNSMLKAIKYIIVGGFTTLINIIVYWIASVIFGLDYKIATTIAWIAAVLFAYLTNKKYVFQSSTSNIRETLVEFGMFTGFRLLSFFMDLGIMVVLVGGISIAGIWAKIWSNLVVLVANYIFSQRFVFKKKKVNSVVN
jgi:putative flippase GtrA